jgi:tRNA modification GTPase
MKNLNNTIAALATPAGRGGIAILRISGPLVKTIIPQIVKKKLHPRVATFTAFYTAKNDVLDEGLALFFPAPNSFTGEDILELHGHGGPAVVDMLLRRLLECGARLAKPGEFSERAFLNDKLDLAQAEAIADLINATSEKAARSAVRSLQGEFSDQIHILIDKLIYLRTFVEAAIDFVEEEVDFLADTHITKNIAELIDAVEALKRNAYQGSLLRDGITVVIAGEPNVGKSTLLNCLSGREIAIVTDVPGTTRDIIREHILLDGLPLHIIDTAGLRVSTDIVEQEGIKRALIQIKQADLVLHIFTDVKPPLHLETSAPIIHIKNKIDLAEENSSLQEEGENIFISISAKEKLGIEKLKEIINTKVGYQDQNEGCFSARRRHLDALAKAREFLQAAQNAAASELLAEDLRQAQLALNEITGEFTSDDLLGKIFSSFCIGK